MTTIETSRILSFNEEEAKKVYETLHHMLNEHGLLKTELVCFMMIFIAVETARELGFPMQDIIQAIADVEEFKEKLN